MSIHRFVISSIVCEQGYGLSEMRLGAGFRAAGLGTAREGPSGLEKVVICTKAGRVLLPGAGARDQWQGGAPFHVQFDYTADGLARSLEQSMLRIGTDRIDYVVIHDLEHDRHGEDGVPKRLDELSKSGWKYLSDLRSKGSLTLMVDRVTSDDDDPDGDMGAVTGVIGGIGAGLNQLVMASRFVVERGFDMDFFLVASRLTLLENLSKSHPEADKVAAFLDMCRKNDVRLLIGGVFNTGVLAVGSRAPDAKFNYGRIPDDIRKRVARLERVCDAYGVPLPAAALQYPHAFHSDVVAAVIPGCDHVKMLRQNLQNLAMPVPKGLWDDLRSESLI